MDKLGPRVRVIAVEPLAGYEVRIWFDTGEIRDVDLERYLHGPVFEPLQTDTHLFRALRVEGGTVAWDNGADIDPDVLYYNLVPAWMEQESVHI
jgi:hypothetical protein